MAGTVVASTINNDTGLFATNNAYLGIAKAWVSFVGSTVAINGSFNVSSVTRNTTGQYTVNFTTAMPSNTYVTTGSYTRNASTLASNTTVFGVMTTTTTTAQVSCLDTSASATDGTYVGVVIFSS